MTMIRFDSPHCSGAAVLTLVILTLPMPARADFFDDTRRTFQTDIPHFFQDDIPCAFGGQPTSHSRPSCKSAKPPGKTGPRQAAGDRGAAPSDKRHDAGDAPARSGR
jgi:hypothetical protein